MLRRLLAALVLALVTAALVVAAWPQAFGLEHAWVLAQAVSLRGVAALAALACALLLLLVSIPIRTFRRMAVAIAALFALFAIVSGGILVQRGVTGGSTPEAREGDVTVLSWNTQGGAPGAEAIARLAVEKGADVVALPETTEDVGTRVAVDMRRLGHPMWVHTIAYDTVYHAHSTTLLISPRLGDYHVVSGPRARDGNTAVLPTVVAKPAVGDGPTIMAVHAVSPTPGQMKNWRADLDWLARQCAGDDVIMAGDFNSTLDHMWGLGTEDRATLGRCRDVGSRAGVGGLGTWPTNLPPLLGTPIDHVMATPGWHVRGMRVLTGHDDSGSKHRPILARLTRDP